MATSGHNSNNETLIGMSSSIGVSFYDENINEIDIKSSQSPIDIRIIRDNQHVTYEYQYVNSTQINNVSNGVFLQNSLTLKSTNASVHIELKPLNKNISYLFFLKLGSLPIVNATHTDYTKFQIFCKSIFFLTIFKILVSDWYPKNPPFCVGFRFWVFLVLD